MKTTKVDMKSIRGKKGFLHVTVGTKDYEPTKKEIQAFADMFSDAMHDQENSVICTGPYVKVAFIETGSVKKKPAKKKKTRKE